LTGVHRRDHQSKLVDLTIVPMIKIIWSIQPLIVEPLSYRPQWPRSSKSWPLPGSSMPRDPDSFQRSLRLTHTRNPYECGACRDPRRGARLACAAFVMFAFAPDTARKISEQWHIGVDAAWTGIIMITAIIIIMGS
jgi:hypothetical protein